MLLGRSRLVTLLLSSTLWLHASAGIGALAYLVLGVALGVDLSKLDLPATFVGVLLMLVGFTGMGLLAGATVLADQAWKPGGLGAARRVRAAEAVSVPSGGPATGPPGHRRDPADHPRPGRAPWRDAGGNWIRPTLLARSRHSP